VKNPPRDIAQSGPTAVDFKHNNNGDPMPNQRPRRGVFASHPDAAPAAIGLRRRRGLHLLAPFSAAFLQCCSAVAAPLPDKSGFHGYILGGATFTGARSHLLAGTRNSDLTSNKIASLDEAPDNHSSASPSLFGEVAYTFATSRSELFAGQIFTDYIRYDVTNMAGVRQALGHAGNLSVAYVFAGFPTYVWQDPYAVDVERNSTQRRVSGYRLNWEDVLGTAVTAQYTERHIDINERSGQTQLNLSSDALRLLDRNGTEHELQLLYTWQFLPHHTLAPELLYEIDEFTGEAMSARGFGTRVTHTYRRTDLGVILITSVLYQDFDYDAENPIYQRQRRENRYGAGITYLQFGLFAIRELAVTTTVVDFRQNANINFYDMRIAGINLGVLYSF
jgi:hypothetical protein